MAPHVLAVTPVAQVTVQVTALLSDPVTVGVNGWVRLVITLAMVGVIVIVTPAELLLLPQPQAPNAAARVSIAETFHQLIPVLPKFLNIRPRSTSFDPWRWSGLSSSQSHIRNSALQNPKSKRPAHGEPERAHRIEEIGPLRVVE